MTYLGKNSVASDDPGHGRLTVTLKVNGQERDVLIDPRMTLLIACAKCFTLLARRKVATTVSAGRARSISMAAA